MRPVRVLSILLALVLVGACSGGGSEDDSAGAEVSSDAAADADGDEASQTATENSGAGTGVRGCTVEASEIALTPVWTGQPDGAAIVVLRDDAEIFRSDPADRADDGSGAFTDVAVETGETYAYQVGVADGEGVDATSLVSCGAGRLLNLVVDDFSCGLRVNDQGQAEISWVAQSVTQTFTVVRDGTEVGVGVTSPFIDETGADDATYSVIALDGTEQGRAPIEAECGTASTEPAQADGSDLESLVSAGDSFRSPFQYVTLTPICPSGCGGTVELYLVPDTADPTTHAVDQVWVDGAPSGDTSEAWVIDPLRVAEHLLAAQGSGQSVTYEVDAGTGLIRSWSVDGVGAAYVCIEVDTRPLDMRDDRCSGNLLR